MMIDAVPLQEVVRDAATQLVSVDRIGEAHFIKTPLIYASGSHVVVRVEASGSDYMVSDFGSGFQEAEMLGGDLIYRRTAKAVAEESGVGFDNFAFFCMSGARAQLPGMIAAIANASNDAVHVTAIKVAEKRVRDDAAILYERLTGIFSAKSVERDAILVGASNTEWHVSSLVSVDGRRVAFEAVTKHPNSIVYAATKFDDISRAKKPPERVAVVSSKAPLGTYLGVLSHSAHVVEAGITDSTIRRLVKEAA